MKRKPTPAQIAARERFAEMARSGAFKRKNNPMVISKQADESLSRKGSRGYVRELLDRYSDDGHVVSVKKTRSGSIGIAFDGGRLLTVESARKKLEDHYGITERMKRRSNPAKKTVSVKRNPISDIANIIYNQLGANRFAMMTGAKNFVAGDNFLMFSIGKNQSVYNKVRITLTPDDLYDVEFFKMNRLGDIAKEKKYEGMYAEQLPSLFTDVTGLYTSLGTMGRRSNPRASNPSKRKANPMINYALVPDDGGFSYGMDDRTPVQFVFSNRDKVRGIYRSFALPKSVTSNPEFQQWASSLPGNSIIASLADLRKMMKRYV